MDPDTQTQEISEAIVDFEQALERLVLDSFARGVPLEDTWRVGVPVADAPDWTVTIEKTYSDETASYRPTLLED